MLIQRFSSVITQAFFGLGAVVLNLIYLLVLLLVGFLIARAIQWLIVYVLKAVYLDKGSQKIGLTALLVKGEIKRTPSEIVGDLVFWFILFVSVISIADLLGLGSVHKLVGLILAYVPSVLSAAMALGMALFVGTLLSSVILVITANANLPGAKTLSRIVYYAVFVFGFVLAIGQLGIDFTWITSSISVVVGAIGLAFAIAFGLGCKDIAGDFISNLVKGK